MPIQEEPHQLNTYLQTIDKSKKDLFITETSNPYQSNPYGSKKTGYDEIGCETYEEVKEMVYENIEYRHFKQHGGIGMRERLDEIADIIIETLCSKKDTINIAGDDYPVSYTHLDVYKRQAISCAGACGLRESTSPAAESCR